MWESQWEYEPLSTAEKTVQEPSDESPIKHIYFKSALTTNPATHKITQTSKALDNLFKDCIPDSMIKKWHPGMRCVNKTTCNKKNPQSVYLPQTLFSHFYWSFLIYFSLYGPRQFFSPPELPVYLWKVLSHRATEKMYISSCILSIRLWERFYLRNQKQKHPYFSSMPRCVLQCSMEISAWPSTEVGIFDGYHWRDLSDPWHLHPPTPTKFAEFYYLASWRVGVKNIKPPKKLYSNHTLRPQMLWYQRHNWPMPNMMHQMVRKVKDRARETLLCLCLFSKLNYLVGKIRSWI